MPFVPDSKQYATWTGHDYPEQAQLVNCLAISFFYPVGPPTKEYGYNICDYGQPFNGFIPLPFRIENQSRTNTTEQTIRIVIDNINGIIYRDYLKPLTALQREDPVLVDHYIYLDSEPATPVFYPPSRYYLHEANITVSQVILEASNTFLPQQRAGTAYTARQFPSLYYL